MSSKMNIAFFDFDGTLTSKDSLEDFIQYAVGRKKYFTGLLFLSPILILYKLKFISNSFAKEKLMTYFFKGWDADHFQKIAKKYSLEEIDKIIRPKAMKKIKWHQKEGHHIVIVSASFDDWLRPWCDINNLNLISTSLEIKNNKLTGKFSTMNCYGIEKVNRIKNVYKLNHYDYIYAYGDSRGDKELLSIADESFYKPFRK